MRTRTHFNVKCQFNPGDLFKAQSLIIRRELGNCLIFGLINYHLIEIELE